MDTLILFALAASTIISFVIGAVAGAAIEHDLQDVPDPTAGAERAPEDDW